ncbi:MAG: hypothetical protein ACR2JY_06425 [Chloroflexota bacterium]
MRAFFRVLFATLAIALVAACGQAQSTLNTGQSYALAPDMSVRLVSYRPSLNELQLQITLLPTGNTALESLVPALVVIPNGGRETSSTLDFQQAGALITMLLADAENVASVTVRDTRSGHSADWAVQTAMTLLPCKGSGDCQLIGMPHAQTQPGHP